MHFKIYIPDVAALISIIQQGQKLTIFRIQLHSTPEDLFREVKQRCCYSYTSNCTQLFLFPSLIGTIGLRKLNMTVT